MRVIGGNLKGKKLYSVHGKAVRPTADRLREAVFNILSFRVEGAVVLDLFAGTGAFGIESLSRGARSAVFIDINKKAVSVIEKNIKECALNDKAKIIKWDIIKNLFCIGAILPAFDLVFMDPPYNMHALKPALINLHAAKSINDEAVIIVEHGHLEMIPDDIKGFELRDQRKYGKTLVSFLNYIV
ncbi:MAG: hypothetical protein SRB1_00581 [Desulfobacteraceae bacterium Eth-SRB1]|nr:MAG: hypothetical protein SRB1_00581 [Desulfobacteraceae bacterium Eth-SRB1]